ncbi:MAG: helix-hairpin-helix domain-containing protein [Methanothrix sp.]|nr:helix-hairpin-helix domain-containing protein [Methanothrix sp.]
MVTLEKIAHLAEECRFDSTGPAANVGVGVSMEVDAKKLSALGEGTRHDVCASTFSPREQPLPGICHAFTQDGRCVSLFKTLYTNHCTHQCSYCTNAVNCSRKARAFSYTPEELANITLSLYRSNYIEGLFLSSGAGRDEDRIMEKMIETVRLLRQKHDFSGYIHLKILPGSARAHIQEAIELADRVSVNLEAASASHMFEICATKNYESDILQRQRYIRDMSSETSKTPETTKANLPAGQTTQLVVGAAGESDEDIFKRVLYEYQEIGVKRAYYSAFSPQRGTSFENRKAQPLWREHRLYQMDWLFRVYHFQPDEIRHAFNENGLLSNADPKMAIAREFMDLPLDPNKAAFRELLRVPGIGPRSAQRIVALRKRQPIAAKSELAAMGVRIKRAAPFLKINGWKDTTLEMWQA